MNTTHGVVARCNWWGDISGPTHINNPGGQGEEVSDGVSFSPWLAEPGGECTIYQIFLPLLLLRAYLQGSF